MINNKSRVSQWCQIRGGWSVATTAHRWTRLDRFECARPRRGDSSRGHCRTCNCVLVLFASAGGCSLRYCLFGNLDALIRPRIGLTVAFFNLIRAFFGQAAALRGRDSGVCRTSVWNWAGGWSIQGSSSLSESPKSLQICSSVSESAYVQHNVGDLPSCGGAGCGNVPEQFICRVFRGYLRLICVEMYNIF